MTFHNIFSSKPLRSLPAPSKIIIDIHEKNSLVPAELSCLEIPFQFQHLEVADYLINNIAIERKTIQDLKSSIVSKRIFTQIKNLKQYSSSLIIIEGHSDALTNNEVLHENAIRGFFLSLALQEKMPLILTESESDTANYLSLLARRKPSSEISLRLSRLPETKEEQLQYILEGFPGIGPATAKKLLAHFKTLKNIFLASEKELKPIIGEKAISLYTILNESYEVLQRDRA